MFHPLEKIEQIVEGYSRCFKVKGKKYLLVHSDSITRLIPIHCPHAGYPLKKAALRQGIITCPKHGIGFKLADGAAVGGAVVDNVAPLQPVPLQQRDGYVGVLLDGSL